MKRLLCGNDSISSSLRTQISAVRKQKFAAITYTKKEIITGIKRFYTVMCKNSGKYHLSTFI
jgi:hypothetical protein